MSEHLNQVRRFLRLDRDDEDAYLRLILYIISITALVATASLAITSTFMGYERLTGIVAGASVLSVVMLLLTWRGPLLAPRIAFPFLTFIIATYVVLSGGGIRDQAIYAYPLTIMLAGLLLGRTGVVAYTLLGILTIAVIGYGEVNGLIFTNFSASAGYYNVIALCALLAFMGILLYVTINNLTNSLRRAQENEEELAASNRELQAIRTSLEDLVTQRTQSADAARQAAEEANKALEAQMWQLAGQTKVSEVMRGEQDLAALANNVIQQICQYLDAQVGMLFLKQDNLLKPVGRYAHQGEAPSLKLGEGLVGQAAMDKQTLMMEEIPEGSLKVVSGLGETAPHHILATPLIYEGYVVGVIEIGTLATFSPSHITFSEDAARSVAAAFNTAQARARIDELLVETKRQAEALQVREEELHALNEELESQAERLRIKQDGAELSEGPVEERADPELAGGKGDAI